MLLAASSTSAQTILYSENFTLPDGTTQGLGTPPNWTLSGNPIFWNHFEVRSNRIEANKISIEGSWISKTFDITGFTDVTLSADLSSAGSLSTAGDYIRGFYKLNGSSEVQWFNITGSTPPVTKTFNGISGGSLQVVIRMRNDNGETWFFDNVTVTGNCATNAGTAGASQTVINSGQTVDLSLSGHNGTIQWQQSTDNITFTDIAGGTTTPFTTAQLTGPAVFYFRAKVTNVCANFSNVLSVTVNEAQTTFTTDSLSVTKVLRVGANSIFLGDPTTPTGTTNHLFSTNGHLLVQSNQGNQNHTIIGNGDTHSNVGIGTNNPQKKLHVRTFHTIDQTPQGGSHYGMRLEDVLTGEGGFPASATTTWDIEPKAGGTEGSTLQIGTPDSPLLTMTETGRIGVNTSTPLAALHVAGDVQADGNLSAQSGRIAGLYAGADGRVGVNTTSPRADLDVNGRVTIGSSTQVAGLHADYTLAVDGKIVAKDVILKLEDWADYVCDSAYALMSPAEMKAFIAKYKHLPGMPSERELLQRGLDIKEMQRLQQVKIEEYAKYIILLNERLTELEKKNALLEKKMQERKGLREKPTPSPSRREGKRKRTDKNMPR